VGRHGSEYWGVHAGVLAQSHACVHRLGHENRDSAWR
jgi:hypothetical protein